MKVPPVTTTERASPGLHSNRGTNFDVYKAVTNRYNLPRRTDGPINVSFLSRMYDYLLKRSDKNELADYYYYQDKT